MFTKEVIGLILLAFVMGIFFAQGFSTFREHRLRESMLLELGNVPVFKAEILAVSPWGGVACAIAWSDNEQKWVTFSYNAVSGLERRAPAQ